MPPRIWTMPRKKGVFGIPFLIPYNCGIINSEDRKKYFYRKKYSWRACLLCILINNMVEFLLPGRGGGWPSVPQNKLLLPWMIFSCLAQTVSPICSKSSQVKFFLQHDPHFSQSTQCLNIQYFSGKEHLCSERLRKIRTSS